MYKSKRKENEKMKKYKTKRFKKINPLAVIFFIIIITGIYRIVLGQSIGNHFYCSESFDDVLLMRYSNFNTHFHDPNVWSLVKTMSFPLYVRLIHRMHLNYTLSVSILWVFAALSVFNVAQKYFKNKYLSLVSYLYFLFLPMAFDSWMGTRIYRNSIIAPFVIIVFSLILINVKDIISNEQKKFLQYICTIIRTFILGILFTFTYFIKEDGLWMFACLIFFSIASVIAIIYHLIKTRNWQRTILYSIIICIPFASFNYGTNNYKEINEKYFGVSAIQTRTSGELGEFVNNVYKVKSQKQNWYVWAPKDSIEKVFKVSPTLQEYPELLQSIEHTPWFAGDISKKPIQGDFLTWVLRSSLSDTGIWKSEKQIDKLFSKVNNEIESAFNTGELEKTDKIQLLSSAVGRNKTEIESLFPLVIHNFRNVMFLQGYTPGAIVGNTAYHPEVGKYASTVTGIEYLKDYSLCNQNAMNHANEQVSIIFKIYSMLNPLLFVGMIIILFFQLILLLYVLIKKRWKIAHTECLLLIGLVVVLFGICIAYSFSINWFSQFIYKEYIDDTIMNYYTVAMPPLMGLAYLFSIGNLLQIGNK